MRRLTPVTALITLIFAIASLLAWQAYDAARSHRQTAERVLGDYARFASWEFGRLAQTALEDAARDWAQACKCREMRPLATFCLKGTRVEATGAPLAAGVEEWLRGLARTRGDGPHRPSHLRVFRAATGIQVVVARLSHRPGDETIGVEGLVTDIAPLQRVLRDIVRKQPLLPPSLAGPGNTLLSIEVRTPDGVALLAADGRGAAAARADGSLDASIGGLRYEVFLAPQAAANLVIGGLPRSRLPLLAGLLALTAALAIAAVLQLRREQQLARLRADFVSSVSHELRTPLAQIRLFSETLLLGRVRADGEGRRALEIIEQESRRLTHLVDNVLVFSRAERGLERVAPSSSALAALAADSIEAFLPLARAARSNVTLQAADGVEAWIDPAAFRQILLNLLDNAVKYGPAGQTIVVGIERRGAAAAVSVTDQGPGIALEARERIWQPYARLVTAATSAVAGTGIGLAVVRRLVELHGGSVLVEDAPGGGARFVVLFRPLPVAAPDDVSVTARSATA